MSDTRAKQSLKGQTLDVAVEAFAHGGQAIARHQGKTIFVDRCVPGDRARVRVTADRGRYAQARLETVLTPSADRITPACPHFDRCGGCPWQPVAYPVQLQAKVELLQETLRRVGGLNELPPVTIHAAPESWDYRHRARFHLAGRGSGLRVGFRQRESHAVAPIDRCALLHPAVNRVAVHLTRALAGQPLGAREMEVVVSVTDGTAAARIIGAERGLSRHLPPRVLGHEGLRSLLVEENGSPSLPFGEPCLWEEVHPPSLEPYRFAFGPDTFTQSNRAGNELLVDRVIYHLRQGPHRSVLELYSGAGNFTLPIARLAEQVAAVEQNERAVELATRSLRAARIDHRVTLVAATAGTAARTLAADGFRPEVVLLDPPRAGAREVAEPLRLLAPQRMLYVSCDPATLARDLGAWRQDGWSLRHLEALDLFPQTNHLESLAVLERSA